MDRHLIGSLANPETIPTKTGIFPVWAWPFGRTYQKQAWETHRKITPSKKTRDVANAPPDGDDT
jgi:hypothetical protein